MRADKIGDLNKIYLKTSQFHFSPISCVKPDLAEHGWVHLLGSPMAYTVPLWPLLRNPYMTETNNNIVIERMHQYIIEI